jgi:tRNA threonylcarbamoyladenosine biosynthesis protein TsaE
MRVSIIGELPTDTSRDAGRQILWQTPIVRKVAMTHLRTHLEDDAATTALGTALAQIVVPGLMLYLHGDLGSGKTALTRALLHAAGHVGPVRSPTYTLAEPYTIQAGGRSVEAVHFDLYRMADPEEFLDAGFRDYFNTDTICIVEWPEKAGNLLPPPDINVFLAIEGEGRAVKLQAISAMGRQCLDRLNFAFSR